MLPKVKDRLDSFLGKEFKIVSSFELQQVDSLWEDQTYSSDTSSSHIVTESRRKLIELYKDCSNNFIDHTDNLINNGELSIADAIESTQIHIRSNQEEIKKFSDMECGHKEMRWLGGENKRPNYIPQHKPCNRKDNQPELQSIVRRRKAR